MTENPLAIPAFLRCARKPEAAPRRAPDPETEAARKARSIARECNRLPAKHGKRRRASDRR